MTKTAMIIENERAEIVFPGGDRISTTRLNHGGYVREDDGNRYPQLCDGAARTGPTLIYATPEALARDCRARLYKTRGGFERAAARLADCDE